MKIVKSATQDGLILSGLLSEPQHTTNKIIIHIHGMAGDIYTGSYYPYMHDFYPESEIAFLAVENRGTHTITEFNTISQKIRVIGNAYEKFEDCIFDIDAWVNFAREAGYTEIWLQGHSLGPTKIAYYNQHRMIRGDAPAATHNRHRPQTEISGFIFLSPSDMIGLVYDPVGYEDHKIMLPEARQLIADGKGSQLLSHLLWESNKLSAETYLNFFEDTSNTAVFNYSKPELGWETVVQISAPVIAFTGTKDDGIVTSMDACDAPFR